MAIHTLLFDVHRTLVGDQGFPRERIWRLMEESGVKINRTAYYRRYDELVKVLFDWPNIQPFRKIREIHRHRLEIFYQEYGVPRNIEADLNFLWNCMKSSQIYPEVPEVLKFLEKKYQLGLLSNADNDDPLIGILLENHFTFNGIITSESVGTYKPDKKIFFSALEKLNCPAKSALAIGDSLLSDILGAANAGIKSVWINRNGHPLTTKFPKPDFEIRTLYQLPEVLENLD